MRPEGPGPDPLAPLVEALHEEGRPRVWSLVVTIFGDAVAPRGGRIATARLGEVTARIGVGEGALRTALSRLVADGTLERDRIGRASFHRLSGAAAREVAAASPVIYGPPAGPGGWTMGAGPAPRRSLGLPGGAWLSRDPPPEGAVAVRGALLWAAGVEPAPGHAEALGRLARDLDALEAAIGPGPIAAARVGGGGGRAEARDVGGAGPSARASGSRSPPAAGCERPADAADRAGARGERRKGPPPEAGDDAGSARPLGESSAPAASAPPGAAGAGPDAAAGEPLAVAGFGPLDAMAARTLLIHRWRRLALRWPDLPSAPGGGLDARSRVARAYAAVLPPSEAWLDAAVPAAAPVGGGPSVGGIGGRFG